MMDYLELPSKSQINYHTVSNSEVAAFQVCEYRHYFAYGLGLSAKNHSDALFHGILGHSVLAAYYKTLKDGADSLEAKHRAMDVYHVDKKTPHMIKMQNMKRMLQYFDHYADDDYKVVLVEEKQEVELVNSIYGFTVDLVLEDRKNRLVLWDHKFIGRFWDDESPKFEPQLPKYVYALRQKGYDIKKAEYNFIKYVDATDLFCRVPVQLHDKKTQNIINEHIQIAERIIERRKLPVIQMKRAAVRHLSKDVCRYCPFKLPCEMELEGRDISKVLATEYEPGEYGYQR